MSPNHRVGAWSLLFLAITSLASLFIPPIASGQLTRTAIADAGMPLEARMTNDSGAAAGASTFFHTKAPSAVVSSVAASLPEEPPPNLPFGGGQFGSISRAEQERARRPATVTDKYILAGQTAPKLNTGDKIELGLIHSVSVYSILGWFIASGYSHVLDGSPNYGTDSGAYGERLGASALRGVTTELLKDSVTAPIFHQDPRYYKMGPRRNIAVRAGYAASRILVTRTDDGREAPNYALVSGHLIGAALTNAYYPNANRGFGQTARTFGSSMYGAAFSFFAREFLIGTLINVHLRQNQD